MEQQHDSFDDAYAELKQWININSHNHNSQSKHPERQLGQWATAHHVHHNQLSPEKLEKLEKLNDWSWQ